MPIDFVFSADVLHGIMNGYDYSQYLYRGERLMYSAMVDSRDGQPHPIATQDDALLTNMFGSPVLLAGWADHTKDSGTQYTAYYCATHNDPGPCVGQTAPLDGNGHIVMDATGTVPMLTPYEGAFTGNATPFTIGGGTGMSSPVAISTVKNTGDTGTGTFARIQEIDVQVGLHSNPYDLTSGPPPGVSSPVVTALIPWAPKQPGIGFPVALDGQREQFIETYQMDFSGEQITAAVDYDFALGAGGQPTAQILFLAVETTDFLGDVFALSGPEHEGPADGQQHVHLALHDPAVDRGAPGLGDERQHRRLLGLQLVIMGDSAYENYLDFA